eukprot:14392491-Alexandrium_andersonii.AAC.1
MLRRCFSLAKKPKFRLAEVWGATAVRRQVARALRARLAGHHGVPSQQPLGHHRGCGAGVDGH